jgi:hypothetical protein
MSSSISSSDGGTPTAWRRWLAIYAATLAAGVAALWLFVVLSDPFSTGRLTPLRGIDIATSVRTLANAGRVRDPSFDSAIIGNSISTRFEPDRLNALSGLSLLQLSIPGLGPDDELALARAFVRARGSSVKSIVAMLETSWCNTDERTLLRYPAFPYWLYESNDFEYLRNIFSRDAVQAAFHRVAIRLGLAREPARRDGYVSNDQRGIWRAERVARLASARRPTTAPFESKDFAALERLDRFSRTLDPTTELVMVLLPFHVSALPEPDSEAAAWLGACKARIASIAATRPRTLFIDRMLEDDITRDPNNFWDAKHVRDEIIRDIEVEIAKRLAQLGRPADHRAVVRD